MSKNSENPDNLDSNLDEAPIVVNIVRIKLILGGAKKLWLVDRSWGVGLESDNTRL